MKRQRRPLSRFVQRWARRRQGLDGDCIALGHNRIYILPTRSGLVFGAVFFTMLLGALNYSNNMGFALAFLLTAVAVVSIHHCQRNLDGLRLTVSGCTPVFAGEPLEMPERFAREMVADWMAASRAYDRDWHIGGWYTQNETRMKLHPNTRYLVEALVQEAVRIVLMPKGKTI